MIKIQSFILTFILLSLHGFPQNKAIDSIRNELKLVKHDTARCSSLYNLYALELNEWMFTSSCSQLLDLCEKNLKTEKKGSELYRFYGMYKGRATSGLGINTRFQGGTNEKAIELCEKGLKIAQETKDEEGIGAALNNLATIYASIGDQNKAIETFEKCLAFYKKRGDKKSTAVILFNIADLYKNSNNEKSLEYMERSLKIRSEINDKLGIALCHSGLGNYYRNKGEILKSIDHYNTGLKIAEELNNTGLSAELLNNLGGTYMLQGDQDKGQECFLKALKFYESNSDSLSIATALNNIGTINFNKKNFKKAENYFLLSLKIRERINNKEGIANSYSSLCVLYLKSKNMAKAEEYCQKSLQLAKEINDLILQATANTKLSIIYLEKNEIEKSFNYGETGFLLSQKIQFPAYIRDAAKQMSVLYRKKNQPDKALEMFQLFATMKDSISNKETRKASLRSQLNYEYEKKEAILLEEQAKETAISIEKARQQRIILWSIVGGLLLTAIFAFVIFNRLKVTRKQKIIIENQKHLVEEKHKEITDSINYAERIQRSFLASKELLDENLNNIVTSNSDGGAYREVKTDSSSRYVSHGGSEATRTDSNYFVFFKPKDVVSGDFYWASKLVTSSGTEKFALATADSTGHGVPGAIMSLLNITSLEKAIEDKIEPSEILNVTRKIIIERLKKDGSKDGGKDGMDCSLCVYDFKNKKLIIAAAHNPVWIVRRVNSSSDEGAYREVKTDNSFRHEQSSTRTDNIEVIEIKADKMPVGKHDRDNVSFTQQEIDLQPGDVVYTLTDGFPDQFGGGKGKKYMSKNLRELLAANSHLPMNEQKQILEKTFAEWRGDLEQVDDVTVVGVRI